MLGLGLTGVKSSSDLVDFNSLCGAPQQGDLLFVLPTTVAFPGREAAVSQGC